MFSNYIRDNDGKNRKYLCLLSAVSAWVCIYRYRRRQWQSYELSADLDQACGLLAAAANFAKNIIFSNGRSLS